MTPPGDDDSGPPGGEGQLVDEAVLLPRVYDELRALAERTMASERNDHTLQPTALVHEAWLRMSRQRAVPLAERGRFLGLAALAMRRILIEHARARSTQKRDAHRKRPLSVEPAEPERDAYLVALDEALDQLAARDVRLARIVELRFFGALTVEETAEVLGVSPRTVKRGWQLAKGWLHHHVTTGSAP